MSADRSGAALIRRARRNGPSRAGRAAPPRRWELSPEEIERIAAARRGPLGLAGVARILAHSPHLIPEMSRVLASSIREAATAQNAIISVLDAERARQVVRDAATGVGWCDPAPFLDGVDPLLRGDVIALELGCGGGRVSRLVAPRVRHLICSDVSRAMVAEAAENLASHGNVDVARTDGFTLREHADDTFDLVFAQGVLCYMDPNPALALLDEVRRVLRPGGHCAFNFAIIDDLAVAQWVLECVRRDARKRRLGSSVERAYLLAQIRRMYETVGLEVVTPNVNAARRAASGGRAVVIGRA